ncbi:MAG: metalloregulator ArsR/SmtB family transcription factor [Gemmatimonadales bacterium]|nr:metalloregulator ArsR/SmtB family transcription factor [Gemmatimonadales bacterium]
MEDRTLVRVLKALADANRFRMVQEIAAAGELNCGQVGERFDLSQPTISHHLKILADAGVLTVRRDGKHAVIAVNHELVETAVTLLPKRLRQRPRQERARLKTRRRDSRP